MNTNVTESLSYELQKRIIHIEVNYGDPLDRWIVDQSVFKKTDKEKALVYNLKHQYRDKMRGSFPEWIRRASGKKKYLSLHYKYTF